MKAALCIKPTNQETVDRVTEVIQHSPIKLGKRESLELELSHTNAWEILLKKLKLMPRIRLCVDDKPITVLKLILQSGSSFLKLHSWLTDFWGYSNTLI
ncbi:hypothetical protein C0J52_20359 [Blattella germanica]|nr:hypothetical protein C0J52_20359 [Blattella germanica]